MTLHSDPRTTLTTVPTPPVTPAPIPSPGVKVPTCAISIDRAVVQEAPSIARLGGDVFTATFGHSVSQEDLEEFLKTTYSSEAVLAEFSDQRKSYLVARDGEGKVVGIAQLEHGKTHSSVGGAAHETATMQKVYVDSSMHGQGVGSKLIQAIEDLAREKRVHKLWLTVWEENVKAQRLYQRLGYERTGEIDFATGACIQTDYVLTKRL
ncbi:acyl-CoA N-acyltransferase [Pestalotiopsis sp. NC0098]|nr:acyl-CoA N-acyltransferase [Pestalotiopsis sp. NC0098]